MSMGNVPDMGNSRKGLRGGNELEGLAGAEGVESKLIPRSHVEVRPIPGHDRPLVQKAPKR